jgi:DNA-binding MarR family transcriptional regulator
MSRDYPSRFGGAAIGARLRRLSDRIDREADGLYSAFGIDFEQRWFGIMNQLALNTSMSVSELAEALGITHVAVSQTRAALAERGLIATTDDPSDARRRVLRLSASGRKLVKQLAPLWAALNAAARELDREAGNVAEALGRLEAALDKRALVARVRSKLDSETKIGRLHKEAARSS